MRFIYRVHLLAWLCCTAAATHATEIPLPDTPAPDGAIARESPEKSGTDEPPVSISAEHLEGQKDGQVEASGNVELHRDGQALFADRMRFSHDTKDVVAEGGVRLEQDGNIISGPHLQLNLDTRTGTMTRPDFHFGINQSRGQADTMDMAGSQNYELHNVSYTTCPAGNDDWLLKMDVLEIDRARQVGVARHALVEFMGAPILYSPWMDFPLGGQRKSGLLGPTIGNTVKGGSEITVPFFWNIAPNLDATLAPRVMSRRGTMLNNEFRYLQTNYGGEAHFDILPSDRLTDSTRSHTSLRHEHQLGAGFSASANLNRVSDDAYFRDLSSAVSSTSQTNLVREGDVSYGAEWWRASLRVRRFQTLQDPAMIIETPYRLRPQFALAANKLVGRADVSLKGEYTDFRHPTAISGQRLVMHPGVSYPLIAQPAVYLTPKFSLHHTEYRPDDNNFAQLQDRKRSVPIFSLDSGVAMEREWSRSGEHYVQTLEPRLYYVYIPYREQDSLPNYDSAQADFSFAQMFTENRFFGNDRVGDANHITLALTSRLLSQDNGAERLRVAIGERFSLKTPRVNLATPSATTNKSDILLAASGQMSPAWSLDSAFQFNPNRSHSEKFNIAARYQPESGRVLNLGYRYLRNSVRQADLSTQWPLTGRWHAMARWNYSLQDNRVLEALAGLEYNQSCWSLRMVAQRFATATNEVTSGFFVQLELNDFMRVGVGDPLSVLQQSISGYTERRAE